MPRVSVGLAGPGDAVEWDRFVDAHPEASLYHRYIVRDVLDKVQRADTYYLIGRWDDGRVAGVLPLARLNSWLFGNFIVSLPYFNYGGVLADGAEAESALLAASESLARDLRVRHLELRETRPRRETWPVRTDKVAMALNLQADPEAQFSALGAKLRSQIRRPAREGGRVERGGVELLHKFYGPFARNMRDLGTPVYSPQFFAAVMKAFGPSAEIIVVSVGDVPAAAGLVLHGPGGTEIPWASSVREWNRLGVNMLLYWEALKAAIERGSKSFDFGRSTVDSGTYRFKAQWGAVPRQLYWHYWLPTGGEKPALNPDNPRFALAIRAWRALPVWCANALGPPIVRRLP